MQVSGLRDSSPEPWSVGEPVAVDHRDLLEVVGKDPCGQEARHPGTHHDGVGVRPAGASAPAMNQSGQPTHLFLPEEDRIEPNVGAERELGAARRR
jgi:hypothetical protein